MPRKLGIEYSGVIYLIPLGNASKLEFAPSLHFGISFPANNQAIGKTHGVGLVKCRFIRPKPAPFKVHDRVLMRLDNGRHGHESITVGACFDSIFSRWKRHRYDVLIIEPELLWTLRSSIPSVLSIS